MSFDLLIWAAGLALATPAFAQAPAGREVRTYTLRGVSVNFRSHPASPFLFLSDSCISPQGDCDALTAWRKSRTLPQGRKAEHARTSQEPSATRCVALGGNFLRAYDAAGDAHGVCEFKDGSSLLAVGLL